MMPVRIKTNLGVEMSEVGPVSERSAILSHSGNCAHQKHTASGIDAVIAASHFVLIDMMA